MKNFESKYSNLYGVVNEISKQSPFQKKAVLRIIENADQRYLEFADDLVQRMIKVIDQGDCYDYIANKYLWYTKTIRIEEMYFAKEGSYRFSEYDEVYQKVYGRDDYMFDYVVGLGMTQIFWPNHWEIMKFFLDNFLPKVNQFETAAEIGVGHGVFHSELLKACPKMQSKLLDVSKTSLDVTRKMIAASGVDPSRTDPILTDVQKEIPVEDNSLDALMMGELIEHIQHGKAVMEQMSRKMKASGFCYFSTAANSPAEDHILLFRTIDEIRQFVDSTGWEIVCEHLGTLNNMSVQEAEKDGHNINYAAVLSIK
ncbi:methyltransferase domain-containing protein [Thermodesulfobacteriota bacterium]